MSKTSLLGISVVLMCSCVGEDDGPEAPPTDDDTPTHETKVPSILSTFLGGGGVDDSYEPSIAVDSDGNVFFSGFTSSEDFPATEGAYSSTYCGGSSARFVAKFDESLSNLLAATFLCGSGGEIGMGLAIDDGGNVFIAGYTTSADFPTTEGAYDVTHNGGQDVYVSKLDNDLSALLSSTFLGGSADEGLTWPRIDMTLSDDGSVYVAGLTRSADFPTDENGYDTELGGEESGDVFVAKLDSELSGLSASTYLGGNGEEWRVSVLVDGQGQVFVCGETESSDFPTSSEAYQADFGGTSDIFVSRFSSDLDDMTASTMLGSNGVEEALAMRLDANGDVYICGFTKSVGFPVTEGAYATSVYGGDRDGYVACFDNALQSLKASTFIGGSARDDLRDMVIIDDALYIVGNSTSADFSAADNKNRGGDPYGDVVILKVAKDLSSLHKSLFLGGPKDDSGYCVARGNDNDLYIGGHTSSPAFPVADEAFDTSYNGGSDCFVSKVEDIW